MIKKRILILSVSGIGNTIMQTPLINEILSQSGYSVDILFGNGGMRSVFANDPRLQNSYIMPSSFFEILKLLFKLRKNRYDYSIACFPSNKLEFHALPFLLGIKKRIIHSYEFGKYRTLSFLSNCFIKSDLKTHDVEQNLSLLDPLEIKSPKTAKLTYSLNEENKRFSDDFIRNIDASKEILGIHPGSGPLLEKRWPLENFIEVVRVLKDKYNIIIFGSPDEIEHFKNITNIKICDSNLGNATSLISECHKFLSADTGLMHIASVFDVKLYVLWGPTSYSRTRPWTKNVEIFGRTDLDCLRYPFGDTKSRFHCPNAEKYMEQIRVDDVVGKLL